MLVWVGDSLLGKPRMEAVTLLAGVAARTNRVRMVLPVHGQLALRDPILLAYQWASLDLLAGGRTVMVGCTGIIPQEGGRPGGDRLYQFESDRAGTAGRVDHASEAALDGGPRDVRRRALSLLGRHHRAEAGRPTPPAHLARQQRLGSHAVIERTHQRVVDHAEGWQTSLSDPRTSAGGSTTRAKTAEAGRDPSALEFTSTTTSTSTTTRKPPGRNQALSRRLLHDGFSDLTGQRAGPPPDPRTSA